MKQAVEYTIKYNLFEVYKSNMRFIRVGNKKELSEKKDKILREHLKIKLPVSAEFGKQF